MYNMRMTIFYFIGRLHCDITAKRNKINNLSVFEFLEKGIFKSWSHNIISKEILYRVSCYAEYGLQEKKIKWLLASTKEAYRLFKRFGIFSYFHDFVFLQIMSRQMILSFFILNYKLLLWSLWVITMWAFIKK